MKKVCLVVFPVFPDYFIMFLERKRTLDGSAKWILPDLNCAIFLRNVERHDNSTVMFSFTISGTTYSNGNSSNNAILLPFCKVWPAIRLYTNNTFRSANLVPYLQSSIIGFQGSKTAKLGFI